MNDIVTFVREYPIVDVHEHHLPEVYSNTNVGLLDLLRQSYAGWTQARPYPLPSEAREEDPMLAQGEPASWDDLEPFLDRSGSNHFVRNLVRGITELYNLGEEEITRANWQQLDEEVRHRHSDETWPRRVLERGKITSVITDPFTDPLLDARAAFGSKYRSVMRINALAMSWHPDARDHNGQSTFEFAERLGQPLDSFDDLERFLEHLVVSMADRGQVGLKNALAYDRGVDFDEPDRAGAERCWQTRDPSPAEQKAFGDFVVDRMCALAGERDVPVQMHLGTALIRGSHPLAAAGLVERHPRTRFLLMHLAYPWSSDLLGMAFVYRNIWIDLTWSFLLSPTHFDRAFHEAIEILPDESRMMLGGDNWHAEETYATLGTARDLIGRALDAKIRARYFSTASAERLATRILSENAREFFRLPRTP